MNFEVELEMYFFWKLTGHSYNQVLFVLEYKCSPSPTPYPSQRPGPILDREGLTRMNGKPQHAVHTHSPQPYPRKATPGTFGTFQWAPQKAG